MRPHAVDGNGGAELAGGRVRRGGGIHQQGAAVLATAREAELAAGEAHDTGGERERIAHGAWAIGKVLDLLAIEHGGRIGLFERCVDDALNRNAVPMDAACAEDRLDRSAWCSASIRLLAMTAISVVGFIEALRQNCQAVEAGRQVRESRLAGCAGLDDSRRDFRRRRVSGTVHGYMESVMVLRAGSENTRWPCSVCRCDKARRCRKGRNLSRKRAREPNRSDKREALLPAALSAFIIFSPHNHSNPTR